jgi:hypothetical protein
MTSGGSCWSAHVLPSGSLMVTNEPHGWTSTSRTELMHLRAAGHAEKPYRTSPVFGRAFWV